MKKGTLVKFIGAQNKQPIEKTYIWATAQVNNADLYLIEHPDGVLLTEENRKDFEGFNPEKLQTGRKYLIAHPGELVDLSQPTQEVEPTTTNEQPISELITVIMPKEYFENIKGFLESQKDAMQKNPFIKIQMGKSEFNEMMAFYDQLLSDTNNALSQPQPTTNNEYLVNNIQQPTANIQQPTSNN